MKHQRLWNYDISGLGKRYTFFASLARAFHHARFARRTETNRTNQEHAPNGELFDYIVSKGRPSPDEAQRLFQQLVTAVEYCHYHFIVHR